MAGPPGPLLGTVVDWREFTAGVRDLLHAHSQVLDRSFAVVETLPARHLHGDFQRRNILLDGPRVGAVDWDDAALESCPGFDLLFLALLAEGDRPDPAVVLDLLEGRDPPFGPLGSRLEAVGVARPVLAPAVAVMTAAWAAGEVRRLQRHRRPDAPRPFGEPFEAVAAHPRLRAC